MTTIAQAIIHRNYPLVKQCLTAGMELNEFDEYGFTPLIETAIVNDAALTKMLLEHGANVNLKDLIGGTALHWAVENNNLEMSRLLLSHKADPNAYNNNGETILIKPILRKQSELKLLLYEHGASATFAMDYINAKLLGHRYDLRGSIDIVSAEGDFVEVGFEGFSPEFTYSLVRYSLEQYSQHYVVRNLKHNLPILNICMEALRAAAQLTQYQQYQTDLAQHREVIHSLLDRELLIIPVHYQGHATAYIVYNDILVRCDRRKINNALNGINIFKIKKPHILTKDFIQRLLYKKKNEEFVEQELVKQLGLDLKVRMMITPQMSGNCAWANVVACVPAIYYLFTDGIDLQSENGIIDRDHPSLVLYRHWRDWDRARALQYFMQEFATANKKRKASIASLLGALLFQRFSYRDHKNIDLARRIIKILRTPGYEYVLQNYLNLYYQQKRTSAGENLKKLIEISDSYL